MITVDGSICIFASNGKPLFALRKSGDGLWYFTGISNESNDDDIELSHGSAETLQKFMTFHTEHHKG